MSELSRRTILAAAAAAAATKMLPAGEAAAQAATPSQPGFHRYRIGSYEVVTISDGGLRNKLEASPARNATLAEVKATLSAAKIDTETPPFHFNTTFVNAGGKRVLIDTGNGGGRAPTVGLQAANLAAAGINPKSVEIVLISHFHGDHITGLRQADGSLTYPNAEIKVGAVEWAYWMDDGEMSRAPQPRQAAFQNVRRIFGSIADKVTKYEWGKEVAPGITAIDTSGHTPGHTSFVVASGSGKLLVHGDVTSGIADLYVRNPGWHPGGDMDATKGVATRRRMFDMLAAERMLSVNYHLAFPGLGHFDKAGEGYRFVPNA
jgi:glyoxylase-like metal-dependent hydrolase (beta-lactamase superfamily II)